jgi:hypothetical protein
MGTKDFAFAFLLGVAVATSLGCSKGSTEAAPGSSSKAVPNEPPPTTPAGPEELALIAPLVVGSKLGAYEVTKILAVHKGVLEIFCRNDRAQVRLSIALLSEKGPEPPAQTDKYAVFYSNRGGDPADAERLAKSLAEILGKHSDVPVPKGMTEFVPSAIPM